VPGKRHLWNVAAVNKTGEECGDDNRYAHQSQSQNKKLRAEQLHKAEDSTTISAREI